MAEISRRTLALGTAAAAAAAVFPGAVAAKPANVPVIWDGKKMWETFEKDGTGFSFPHKPGSPKAYVTFDTQCPDCIRFYDNIAPLLDNINLVWCPIAFLNIHSDPQGAAILIARTRLKSSWSSTCTSGTPVSGVSAMTSPRSPRT